MDHDAHWQAIYDDLRVGLDIAHSTVPLLAIHSTDQQTADEQVDPPYVVYSQETHRPMGAYTTGPNAVVMSGWRVTVRSTDLEEGLAICAAIDAQMELEAIADTTDGYVTTAVMGTGFQTLWEVDSKLHAFHMRFDWERAK